MRQAIETSRTERQALIKAPPFACRYPNVISQCKPEIAKPGLDCAVRPVALFLICNSLVELLCLRARFVQHGSPVASVFGRITARRGRKPSRSDIEQQPANGPQVVGEKITVAVVEIENARAHGEEMLPTAELHIGTRHRVVALDDCRIEGRHKSGMQKIEKIGYRGTQPFNLLSIDCVDPGDDFFRSIAAGAMVKKRSEEHTSELQSLMRNSYAVFCLKKKKKQNRMRTNHSQETPLARTCTSRLNSQLTPHAH